MRTRFRISIPCTDWLWPRIHMPESRSPPPSQAVIFLTHIENPRIAAHFERMRRELQDLLPVYLCVHEPAGPGGPGRLDADFRITPHDAQQLLPQRFALMRQLKRSFSSGFPDLCYMPAMLHPALRDHDYFWMIECDLDYSGNWRDFFARVMVSDADLLTTTLYRRNQCADWFHWTWFGTPEDVPQSTHLRCFSPIVRFSRNLLDLYVRCVADQHWRGHTEALFGTIASHAGLRIEDLGGSGPFCPAAHRLLNYSNTPAHPDLFPGTLIYRPQIGSRYFHEQPDAFAERNRLYHPVKTYPLKPGWRQRMAQAWTSLRSKFVA